MPEITEQSILANRNLVSQMMQGQKVVSGSQGDEEKPSRPSAVARPPSLGPSNTMDRSFKEFFKTYYAPMRLLGYLGSALDKEMEQLANWIAKGVIKKENWETKDSPLSDKATKRGVGFIEAVFFGGLSAIYFFKERREMNELMRPVIEAEKRRNPDGLDGTALKHSANPIIHAARKRLHWAYASRGASDMAFIRGVTSGIVAQAFRVTAERTIFGERNAYERLRVLFENVQEYHFDIHSVSKVGKDLANIVQQAQKDHGRAPWERALITQYYEFFEAIAEEIVEKRMGMPETTFLLGEVMVNRLTAEEAMELFSTVKEQGLKGVQKPGAKADSEAVSLKEELAVEIEKKSHERWSESEQNKSSHAGELVATGPRDFRSRQSLEISEQNLR